MKQHKCAKGIDSIDSRISENDNKQRKQHRADWLRLIRDRRWSTGQKRLLLSGIGSPTQIYRASPARLAPLIRGKWQTHQPAASARDIEPDVRWLEAAGHFLLTIDDDRYPSLLKEIHDPPIALFAKGNIACLAAPKVAMVGSRRPSPAGTRLTGVLAQGLARLGIVVTSGMALGVDGSAHQGALAVDAPTIAVMGCGLDVIYPARHRQLFAQIAACGCLLSEYPLGLLPTKFSFPQRNRVVSGLSYGVVIIEAAERSGTLITARLACEQNREVMVVPGSALSPQYKGSHNLIQQGAGLVTAVEDILAALAPQLQHYLAERGAVVAASDQLSVTSSQSHLLAHVGYDSTTVDELIKASGLTSAEVSAMLLMLEVEGAVAVADDGGYVKLC